LRPAAFFCAVLPPLPLPLDFLLRLLPLLLPPLLEEPSEFEIAAARDLLTCTRHLGRESGRRPRSSRAAIPRSVSLPYSWLGLDVIRIATATRRRPRRRRATWWSAQPVPEPQPPLK